MFWTNEYLLSSATDILSLVELLQNSKLAEQRAQITQ
jgi:hypothetical protein